MLKILLSWKYFLYAFVVIIYTPITYFFDYRCLVGGEDGDSFCGVIGGILNFPAIIAIIPLDFLLSFPFPGIRNIDSQGELVFFLIRIVFGWLMVGAVIGWLVKRAYEIPVEGINTGGVIEKNPTKKVIFILHWLGVILLIASPFIDLIVLLAIPLFLITMPTLLLQANKIAEAGDAARARRYRWLAVSPFIVIALGLLFSVISNYIGFLS